MQRQASKPGKDVYRVIGNALAGCYARIADFLWGCRHRRTTMPITLPAGTGAGAQTTTQADTYMVCLDCGRHLAYDWGARFNSPGAGPNRPISSTPPGRSVEPDPPAPGG